MQSKTKAVLFGGAATLITFTAITALVRDTEWVWLETRAMGLLSYLFLFASVASGEWRILTKCRTDSWLSRYHHAISIFAVFLVLAHFTAAFADNYKWGKSLSAAQYLGLSFSNKWLALLSLGVLAFYLLLLTGLASSGKAMCFMGFRRWKIVHYLSYAAFFISYAHAVNLGTDFKASALQEVLSPAVVFSLVIVLGLMAARILNGLKIITDLTEVYLAVILFTLVFAAGSMLVSETAGSAGKIAVLETQVALANESLNAQELMAQTLNAENQALKQRITEVSYGKNN